MEGKDNQYFNKLLLLQANILISFPVLQGVVTDTIQLPYTTYRKVIFTLGEWDNHKYYFVTITWQTSRNRNLHLVEKEFFKLRRENSMELVSP